MFDGKELVIFDFDDTIAHLDVDWDAVAEELVREARTRFGSSESFEDIPLSSLRICDAFGEEARLMIIDVMRRHERAGIENMTPLLPVVELVRTLRTKKAVVSGNVTENVEEGLRRLGILDLFDLVVGRDRVKRSKPDPESINFVLDVLGVDPEKAVMVGNSDRTDGASARAAGVDYLDVRELF
ncbi:MAG: HAD-IA family hydrolase [Candidatus Diapherotrites archaeon]|nr:HAD-IA family hydrolase [Candidatus Diapherotrites archaeon]